ncbi:MAG: hypothetical protein U0W24_26575 [Bacteroidales bacterium]
MNRIFFQKNRIKSFLPFLRKIVFFIVLYTNSNTLFSQLLNDEICISGGKMEIDYRKKPWKGNNAFLFEYLNKIKYFEDIEKIRYVVPVKLWVYHNNKGEGGASPEDIKSLMDDLNHYNELNNTGFMYYISSIKHVNNSNRLVFGYYFESTFQTFFRHTKPAVNVHLIDAFKKKQESRKVIKGTYNLFTNSIVIQLKNSTTGLTHEIGHYFGLLHPHRHYNNGKSKQEPVSRTREGKKGIPLCEEKGDLLADTKAEPKLTFLVNNDCQFTGNALKDAWGDNYNSDVNNIMSYPTHYSCRNSFTTGQKAIMLYSAERGKYGKYWNQEDSLNRKYLFDKNEPDNRFEWAGEIQTGQTQEFNFHKIFLGKSEQTTDTCDWIKFEVKSEDNRNVTIVMNCSALCKHDLTIQFFDKNLIPLSTLKSVKPGNEVLIKFDGLVSDFYYLKVNSPENEDNRVDKYSIRVELNN